MKKGVAEVSVVIPVFNAEKTIELCLQSVLNQNYPGEYELIVVDDGSMDGTAKIIKDFMGVKFLYQKNAGPAAARNRGWKEAKGEIVIFTDSDCEVDSSWLEEMVEPFRFGEKVGAVGGGYNWTINDDKKLAVLVGEEIKYRYSKIGKWTDAHGSYSLAVRKKVLEKIKGFDESYPVATAEDWDLCYKVGKAGYKIYFNKRAKVGHRHPEKLYKYLKTQFRHGYYRVKLYKNHPEMIRGDQYSGDAKWMVALSAVLILSLLVLILNPLLSFFVLILVVSGMIFLQKDLFIYIYKKLGLSDAIIVILIQISRSMAWGFGFLKGLLEVK